MLNWNKVLDYVKGNLALPSGFFEKNDKELTDRIKISVIPEFSLYYPDIETTLVLIEENEYKVIGKSNHYRFYDEEDLDILDIKQCYFSMTNEIDMYHPVVGPTSFEDFKWWSLGVFKSRFFQPFSMWSKTYKFIQPNIVRVLPEADENFVVEYEREQPHDLRRIPNALKKQFMDLCLADVMIWIGRIRTGYATIQTPNGEISLNGDSLKGDGETIRDRVIEQLKESALPPFIFDIE